MRSIVPTSPHRVAPAGFVPDLAGTPALNLVGIRQRFGPVDALRGVDLRVEPGEVVALLGPNGAGKSTLADLILGLTRPTAGAVEVFGLPARRAVARGLVAAVMQSGGLLRDLTVAETVRYFASIHPQSRSLEAVLERAGIAGIATRLVGACSGGEQQRVRFALALLSEPRMLVLDEPTTGMDVEGRHDFWQAVRADAEQGRTVLFATHQLEEADAFADRIVLLRDGVVVADGPADRIRASAGDRVVRATLPGADVATLRAELPAAEVDLRGDTLTVRGADADAIARYLLTHTGATGVEISAPGLEEAFLALTAPHRTASSAGAVRHVSSGVFR